MRALRAIEYDDEFLCLKFVLVWRKMEHYMCNIEDESLKYNYGNIHGHQIYRHANLRDISICWLCPHVHHILDVIRCDEDCSGLGRHSMETALR